MSVCGCVAARGWPLFGTVHRTRADLSTVGVFTLHLCQRIRPRVVAAALGLAPAVIIVSLCLCGSAGGSTGSDPKCFRFVV